jgi:hypothetical protein
MDASPALSDSDGPTLESRRSNNERALAADLKNNWDLLSSAIDRLFVYR